MAKSLIWRVAAVGGAVAGGTALGAGFGPLGLPGADDPAPSEAIQLRPGETQLSSPGSTITVWPDLRVMLRGVTPDDVGAESAPVTTAAPAPPPSQAPPPSRSPVPAPPPPPPATESPGSFDSPDAPAPAPATVEPDSPASPASPASTGSIDS